MLRFAACIIAIALTIACAIEPSDERPGLRLSGEVHSQPVEDWSFSEDAYLVFIETVTSYWIPHSVTVWCVTMGGELYVASTDPETKSWVANVARDPNIRIKIKDKVYEQELMPITHDTTIASIDRRFAEKYGYEEDEDAPDDGHTYGYWRVIERD